MIDGRFRMAGAFAFAAAAMSSVGVIHSFTLQIPQFDGITVGYLIIGAFFYIYPALAPKEDLEHRIIVPDEPDLINDDSPAQQA